MKSILVVDDSAVARRIAVKCLSSIGVGEKIREARNGQEALDMIREEAPDLILADLNMPVLDGVSMVRKIKANPRLVGIPVIVSGGVATNDDILRSAALRDRNLCGVIVGRAIYTGGVDLEAAIRAVEEVA